MMQVGETIKSLRTERRWTQAQLAEKAGVSASVLCRVEKGFVEDPGIYQLAKVARALGMKLADLIRLLEGPESGPEGRRRPARAA